MGFNIKLLILKILILNNHQNMLKEESDKEYYKIKIIILKDYSNNLLNSSIINTKNNLYSENKI